jgi:hypothetical protein
MVLTLNTTNFHIQGKLMCYYVLSCMLLNIITLSIGILIFFILLKQIFQ